MDDCNMLVIVWVTIRFARVAFYECLLWGQAWSSLLWSQPDRPLFGRVYWKLQSSPQLQVSAFKPSTTFKSSTTRYQFTALWLSGNALGLQICSRGHWSKRELEQSLNANERNWVVASVWFDICSTNMGIIRIFWSPLVYVVVYNYHC